MANIPQFVARPGIDGNLRVNATPEYDQGLAMASRALGDVSEAAGNFSAVLKQRENFRDNEWTTEAAATFPNAMAEYQAKPENTQSESYADDLREMGLKQQQDWIKAAPSEPAKKRFKAMTDAYIQKEYRDALAPTEANRQRKADDRLLGIMRGAANDFQNQNGTPADATGNYFVKFNMAVEGINASYGATPALAEKKREAVHAEMVAFLADKDPALAEERMKNATGVSEIFRTQMLNHIEAQKPRVTAEQRGRLETVANRALEKAVSNGTFTRLKLEDFTSVYGEDGHYHFNQTMTKIEGAALGHGVAQSVGMSRPQAQMAAAQDELDKLPEDVRYYAAQTAAKKITENLKVYEEGDYINYLYRTDPKVREMGNEMVAAAAGTAMSDGPLPGIGGAVQGAMTARANKANSDYYDYIVGRQSALNVPQDKMRMFTKDQSQEIATGISSGNPDEILKRYNQIAATFSDETHEAMAVNELIHSESMNPAYAPVLEHRNTALGWRIAASVKQNLFASGGLDPEKKKAIQDYLEGDPSLLVFQSIQLATSPMRASIVGGYKSTIANLAAGSVLTGMEPKEAVKRASEQVINTHYITVNTDDDKGMVQIPKRLPGMSRPLTQEDAPEFARRMEVAKERLDVTRLDMSTFPYFEVAKASVNEKFAMEQVRIDVLTNTIWRETSDRTGGVLYYKGSDGEFALKTKSGKHAVLYYDKLPEFTEQRLGVRQPSMGSGMMGLPPKVETLTVPIKPKGVAAATTSKEGMSKTSKAIKAIGVAIPPLSGMANLYEQLLANPRETNWPIAAPGEDAGFITEE